MTWLQKRLDELGYTHEDLRRLLARYGIKRSRATITGWTNDKSIPLLSNPEHAHILAQVLRWSLLELLIAADYDIGITSEIVTLIQQYNALKGFQKKLFIVTTRQFMSVASSLSESEVEEALQIGE